MKTVLSFLMTLGLLQTVSAQSDSTQKLTVSGYAEMYYGYDFNRPSTHTNDGFLYNFNRHNEVNLNLGLIKLAYQTDRIRGNLALMAGTYAQVNLAAEPELLRLVYEANVGIRLGKQLWLDAGIMPSHLGFESAIGKDNWTLSRSLVAENSPYYEAGVKLTHSSDRWTASVLLLNGWQRIRRVDGNQTPAAGWQVQYKPSARITLNSSSFIGNDQPDSTRKMRYFHNFYGIFQINTQWGLTVGLDNGWQQTEKGSRSLHSWYAPLAIVRFSPNDRFSLAGRAEYYNDANHVIIAAPEPFSVWGFSVNADYRISEQVLIRAEARQLSSSNDVFQKNGAYTNQNTTLRTSVSIAF